MYAFAAFLTLIRTTMALAVVAMLAFGALAAPLSAAQQDHHATTAVDDNTSHGAQQAASCPSGHGSDAHDAGDGTCCVGTCTTILGVAAPVDMPGRLLALSGPSFQPMVARLSSVEFIRPPSLAI